MMHGQKYIKLHILVFTYNTAPPQFAILVQQWLDSIFLSKWLGRISYRHCDL